MKPLIISSIILLFLSNKVLAQQTAKRIDSDKYGYLEYLPPDYEANPTKKYPLLLFLHGLGEKGNGTPSDLERVKVAGPPARIEEGHNMCFTVNGKEECFIVISPQTPYDGWYVTIIDEVLDHVLNGSDNYRIDENRIYLTGLSLGGIGTWEYLSYTGSNTDKLAAVAPVAGKGYGGCTVAAKQVPIWAFHGNLDNTVSYTADLAAFNTVKDCTSPVPTVELKFTTYEGVGHNCWSRAYRVDHSLHDPNLYEWLLSKSKSGNPTAIAGLDQTITLPTNTTVLSGSGTDNDGTIVSYAWAKVNGPAATLQNQNTANLTLQNLVEGLYTFQLTVTDNDGNTGTDDIQVTVNPEAVNQSPTVDVGLNINITLPINSTNITGTASDPDGSISTYLWTQKSGGPSTATLSGTATNTLTASDLVEGIYVFRLTVTDDDGATAYGEVSVIVNPEAANVAPNANAGTDQTINLPTNSTTVTGSGSDTDGSIASYLWEKVSGPAATLSNQSTTTLSLSNLVEGVYIFRLTVTDNDGASNSDDVQITVVASNQNPAANAGTGITLTLPTNSTTLSGSGSDPDGSIASYAWAQLSGPAASTIANASNAVTGVSNLQEGTYTFQLTVTDNEGAEATDEVQIIVQAAATNQPPGADAGEDISITLPTNSVTINGQGTDNDGTISSYLWTKISGPSSFTFVNATSASVTINNLVAGTYTFRLKVTDNDGAAGTDEVMVNVAPETVNQSPSVDAGNNKNLTLPTNSTALTGVASDADGSVVSYNWTQISGPSSATLTNATTITLTVSNLTGGTYSFQLEVTDDDGATATDNVMVTVSAANIPPSVSAGDDVNLMLPTNSTDITGIASDTDGSIVSTNWSQTGGVVAAFTTSGSTISITNLIAGYYTFKFTATDDKGASSSDQVQVVVTTSNSLPTVSAGANKTITLPVNSVNLSGFASDTDGSISSYAWVELSGPSSTLVNENTSTLTANNLLEGVYVFQLTATDNDGGVASDDVQVTVLAEDTNSPPVANAGPNKNLTLPTNSLNLNGNGSDADGSITQYAWTKQSGPAATITNADKATLTLTNLIEGTYTFRLTVTDDDGATSFDQAIVVVSAADVNQLPTANAGSNIQISLPTNSTNLNGSGSDPDGSIVDYLWQQVDGPNTATLSATTTATITASNLIEGSYTFSLTVTDDDGATDIDDINITVLSETANQVPTASAGVDRVISLPTNSLTISGSGSDPDGAIASYLWTKLTGATATLANADKNTLSVSDLIQGTYSFRLRVTDNEGATDTDDMTVQVLPETTNLSPTVNAGADLNLILPDNSTNIQASVSDVDGSVATYLWSKINGNNVTLNDTDKPTLQISDLVEGLYTFRLTATDDDGAEGSDQVNVNVLPEGSNSPPTAYAGPDLAIGLPQSQVTISGSGSDTDGTIDQYLWEKLSGPTCTLIDPGKATLEVSDLLDGAYTFRLTVTDNNGADHADDMTLTVLAESTNFPPIVDAGPNKFIDLPVNSLDIIGSASDIDGTIDTYNWEQQSGNTSITISGSNTSILSLSNLTVGKYAFRLTATDNEGLSNSDMVTVTVEPDPTVPPEANEAPVAFAGNDIILDLPIDSVLLVGTGTDDQIIVSSGWQQTLGNSVAISEISSDSIVIKNLDIGEYEFEYTVSDSYGVQGADQVHITVNASSADPSALKTISYFSPNGDGIGDFWILSSDIEQFRACGLKIFDIRGVELFKAEPYENNWDGTFHGKKLPEGVYYYTLKCSDSNISANGSITLIR